MGIIRPNRQRNLGNVGPAKNVRVTPVDEGMPYGTYVWQLPTGKRLADSEGRYLSIEGQRDDIVAQAKLRDAALAFSSEFPEIIEGRPVFLPGRRKISDEQYQEQVERSRQGEILETDLPAIYEEQKLWHKDL